MIGVPTELVTYAFMHLCEIVKLTIWPVSYTHLFIPHQGVYVLARQYQGKTVLTVLNGTSKEARMDVKRYAEVIGQHKTGVEVQTGKTIDLTTDILLEPRQTMIIEL